MTDKSKKKMDKSTKVRLGAAGVALSGLLAYQGVQAVAATATLNIIARLIRAIELTVNTTLDFGTLAMTADRPGQATIDPEVNRLFIKGSSSLALAGGKPTAGRLLVKGAEYPIAISIDQPTVNLTNGTDTMKVNNFNLVSAHGGGKMTFTPTQNTYQFSIPIGATVTTRVGQVSGVYTGINRIYANYQ